MKILFAGDSITAGDRDELDPADLGSGYVKIAAGKMRLLYPDMPLEFVNRGVGGERTADLLARIKGDLSEQKPEIVVLQIGINDVWHRFTHGTEVTAEQFRENYEKIVAEIKTAGAKLFIIEPYALKMGDKQRLRAGLDKINAVVREVAAREADGFIPMDEIFAGVTQDIAPKQFSTDGVHPTHRGCRYIADLLIKELKKHIT